MQNPAAKTAPSARHSLSCGNDAGENNRLSAALNFSTQLSEARLREMAQAYRKRWTPAARAKKAQLIQHHKPWVRRRRDPAACLEREMRAALRAQAAFLRDLNRAIYARKCGLEWPADRLSALYESGRAVSARLCAILAMHRVAASCVGASVRCEINGKNIDLSA